MMAAPLGPIPQADPLPLPAPTLLLWGLLLLLFFLHLLAVNVMLGGSLIGAVARLRGRRKNRPHDRALAAWFGTAMPVLIATAVTLGVAALLFLQVLYGRLFFTSAVLVGWFWLAVIPVLILAYGSAYRLAFGSRGSGTAAPHVLGWVVAGSLLAIAFIYVSNMSLLIRPDQFAPKYIGSERGWHLNLADPTFVPRVLHLVLGAIAIAGLAVAHVGLARERLDAGFGRWATRHGSLWFSVATAVNLIAGIWWLAALPKETVLRFMGRSLEAALALAGGVILGLASLVLVALAVQAKKPAGMIRGGSAALVLTLGLMLLTRDQVRTAALEAAGYTPAAWVAPQWGLMLIFAVLLVAALALTGGMLVALARGGAGARPTDGAGATRPQ